MPPMLPPAPPASPPPDPSAPSATSVTTAFSSRLFWKLLAALWVSTLLAMLVAIGYLHDTLGPPEPPPGLATIGPLPVVPLAISLLAMLLVGAAVAWYLSGPLRHLSEGLHRVAQGHFDTRVAPRVGRRNDELSALAADFDRMAEQLQRLTAARQELLHDISHELRSPLARMQAAIGLLQQDGARMPEMVERIEREAGRLDALIEELLTLHRLEAAPDSWALDRVDLLDLLHAVAEDADFEARAQGRSVRIDAPGEFVAQVHGELLYRAFENVIRNAVKYTAPGSAVEVQARPSDDGSQLVVTVADRGPGVPDEARERMFEPFTRLDASSGLRGVGLGLTIARRALGVHGGRIDASAREGGGLLMTLRLPRPQPSSSTSGRFA